MYNKLFSKIVTSSIWLEPTPTRMIWITFLALMDEDGFAAVASIANLAHTARISLEETAKAVEILESPDENSGDKDHEGRRIERVPGGWMVLNAKKYRDIVTRAVAREKTRERVRRFRERDGNGDVTLGNKTSRSVTPSEAVSDSYAEAESLRARASTEGNPDSSYEVTEAIKIGYPAGTYRGSAWMMAQREVRRLMEDGATRETLVAASLAYREQQDAAGNVGTKFILSPLTFFRDGNWKGPFPVPKKAETKEEATRRKFISGENDPWSKQTA